MYVQTLRYIFKEDVLKFVTIFVVVLLLFMGCLGLALRDDLDTAYQRFVEWGKPYNIRILLYIHQVQYDDSIKLSFQADSFRFPVQYCKMEH